MKAEKSDTTVEETEPTVEEPVGGAEEAPPPAEPPEEAPPPAEPPEDTQPASPAGAGEAEQPDRAAEYLALAQRTQADFENYRKRMAREQAQALDRGMAKLAKELLPALDHLDHALKAAEGHTQPPSAAGTSEDVVKGFALVRDEIVSGLARVGIQPFAPQGEPFDPNEHEAMAQQPSEDAEPGTVIEVYQQGYRLNGAVLRPARVVVAA
jgi:molecular chaperone GrpE